tara:strand:- start:164 stop:823 length:660 start_codon:yes stop_codon:yes gene_type:complete
MQNPFSIEFNDLPKSLPVFPLPSVLLLPGGRLPLNIFEPRYISMILDSLSHQRLIGIIQTRTAVEELVADKAEIFTTGCVGRIVSFTESSDGRLLITLDGLCRFNLLGELEVSNGYRRFNVSFDKYKGDMEDPEGFIERREFGELVKEYFDSENLNIDIGALDKIADKKLLANLAMLCPFETPEKQALMEAESFDKMLEIMGALMKMSIHADISSPNKN